MYAKIVVYSILAVKNGYTLWGKCVLYRKLSQHTIIANIVPNPKHNPYRNPFPKPKPYPHSTLERKWGAADCAWPMNNSDTEMLLSHTLYSNAYLDVLSRSPSLVYWHAGIDLPKIWFRFLVKESSVSRYKLSVSGGISFKYVHSFLLPRHIYPQLLWVWACVAIDPPTRSTAR